MKLAMLALRATPQGEEYFKLNRAFPGPLPAPRNHQGRLSDAENESDAKYLLCQNLPNARLKP